jgi:hypothetical protein
MEGGSHIMSLRRGRDDPADIRFEERQERIAADRDEHALVEASAFTQTGSRGRYWEDEEGSCQ